MQKSKVMKRNVWVFGLLYSDEQLYLLVVFHVEEASNNGDNVFDGHRNPPYRSCGPLRSPCHLHLGFQLPFDLVQQYSTMKTRCFCSQLLSCSARPRRRSHTWTRPPRFLGLHRSKCSGVHKGAEWRILYFNYHCIYDGEVRIRPAV